jgi:oligopeptide/dipeptide ABC transporter ATP-binding protein
LRSIPTLKQPIDRLAVIPGNVPSPFAMPAGCRFHPRCPLAIPGLCDVEEPPLIAVNAQHVARCVLAQPQAQATTPPAAPAGAPKRV